MDIQKNEISEITVKISEENGILVLTAQGCLIYQTIQSAKEQIVDLPTDRERYLLDLREITKIDSTGFGLILNLIKRIPKDRRLAIVVEDPFIRELFTVTKVDVLVDLFDTMQDAVSDH